MEIFSNLIQVPNEIEVFQGLPLRAPSSCGCTVEVAVRPLSPSPGFLDFLAQVPTLAPWSPSTSDIKIPRYFFREPQRNPEGFLDLSVGRRLICLGYRKEWLFAVSSQAGSCPEASGLECPLLCPAALALPVPSAFLYGLSFSNCVSFLGGLAWLV